MTADATTDITSTGGASALTSGRAFHTQGWLPQLGDLWVSPAGDDANAGTESKPVRTLASAVTKWSAGKTIWMRAGTYAFASTYSLAIGGGPLQPLRISGAPGGEKPVLDFTAVKRATSSSNDGAKGIDLSASYVHLRYLEIKGAGDNCVYLSGGNNVLEWLQIHDCQDTGLQITGPNAANNRIINCDSYLNKDPKGENADGFAAKLGIGQGNAFLGCRAWQNTDDGWDCWMAGNASPVTFESCWAFDMMHPDATAASDGNGFKLGTPAARGDQGNAAHQLTNCFAFHNPTSGFTTNGNQSGGITCTHCGAWQNLLANFSNSGGGQPIQHTGDVVLSVSPDKARSASRDLNGNLPAIESL